MIKGVDDWAAHLVRPQQYALGCESLVVSSVKQPGVRQRGLGRVPRRFARAAQMKVRMGYAVVTDSTVYLRDAV